MDAKKIRQNARGIVLALAILAGLAITFSSRPIAQVEAQSGTNAPFTLTFTLPASGSEQFIPGCTGTLTTGCIPGRNQIAHSATLSSASPSTCGIFIDESADNISFQTIGANSAGGLSGGAANDTITAQANGFYPHIRLKISACSLATVITYTGYSSPIPIEIGAFAVVEAIQSYSGTGQGFVSPTVLQSFQVTNLDTAAAYVWVTANVATRTDPLVDHVLYKVAVPGGQTFSYHGPPICLLCNNGTTLVNYLYFKATTDINGTTPVTTPLLLDFQASPAGPYYPYFPLSQ